MIYTIYSTVKVDIFKYHTSLLPKKKSYKLFKETSLLYKILNVHIEGDNCNYLKYTWLLIVIIIASFKSKMMLSLHDKLEL